MASALDAKLFDVSLFGMTLLYVSLLYESLLNESLELLYNLLAFRVSTTHPSRRH